MSLHNDSETEIICIYICMKLGTCYGAFTKLCVIDAYKWSKDKIVISYSLAKQFLWTPVINYSIL